MIKKIFKNKKNLIFILLFLIVFVFIYFKFWSTDNKIKYVLGDVSRGKIELKVSGSGFVLPINQIDLKTKSSAEVLKIFVKEGQKVKAGDLIIKLDDSDVLRSIRDAELSIETAKLSLEKIKKQYNEALRADSLNKNYEDGMTILSDLYNNYSSILNGLNNFLFNYDFQSENKNNIEYYSTYNIQFLDIPEQCRRIYDDLKNFYNKAFHYYNEAKRGGGEDREKAIRQAYDLVLKTSRLLKISRDTVLYLQNKLTIDNAVHSYKTIIDNHISILNNYSKSIDNYLKNILDILNNINNIKDLISNYPLDIKNKELEIKQKENALIDAKEKLKDYYIRAPFDGIITNILVKERDIIPGGVVVTLISEDKIVEISLNELDIANVQINQKAVLTFDAIPELKATGTVFEISSLGKEEQGVVSYKVKISFEDKLSKAKPGMSVTADIITKLKEDVLLIPNSAIKIINREKYVEKIFKDIDKEIVKQSKKGGVVLDEILLQKIEVGLSNDEFSEITEGLKEGDIIVLRTINNSTNLQPQSSAIFRFPGGGSGTIRGFGR